MSAPPRLASWALESPNIRFFSASSSSKEHARFELGFEVQPQNHGRDSLKFLSSNPISHVDDGDMDLIRRGNQDPGAEDGNETDICLVNGCQDVGALF